MNPHTYIFIPGSHPELSLSELLSSPFLPKEKELIVGNKDFFLFEFHSELKDPQQILNTLGGTIKIARVRSKTDPKEAVDEIIKVVKERYDTVQKKVRYGLSFYSKFRIPQKVIFSTVKKSLKAENVSSRYLQSKSDTMNAGVIYHEKLLEKDGIDIVFCESKGQLWIAETVAAQNIDLYSMRDYDKPVRDMRQGIMPPKLAQIMINLAGVKKGSTIWDPFCGSGVVLMEGLLMGYQMIGSDINKKAIRDSEENIIWLRERVPFAGSAEIFPHDATKSPSKKMKVDSIVTESYLGPPQHQKPDKNKLPPIMDELANLHEAFFRVVKKEYPKIPIVITFPFFRLGREDVFLKQSLDRILKLGYKTKNLIDPELQKKFGLKVSPRNSLLYFRKDQRVGREIFCFEN